MSAALGPFPDEEGYDEAEGRDAEDRLAGRRAEFVDIEPGLIYLDGNSLGRLPRRGVDALDHAVRRQWGERLVRGWDEGWWDLAVEVGARLAPVLGARHDEVVIGDSTSVNLFKLACAALDARRDRRRIVTDDLNFPTDIHVLRSAAAAVGAGHEVEIVASDGVDGPVEELEAALDDDTALLALSHVTYTSGHAYDVARLTAAAHAAGAMVVWDLSHSAGSVPVGLAEADADLAVGCTYKYLNGGPGAPAFLFVRRDLQEQLRNPIAGWWGHADPFGFELGFTPATGLRRFHTGTLPILSLVGAQAGISQVAEVGIDAIRNKSVQLVGFAQRCAERHLTPLGFRWASPRDPACRGSHVAVAHDSAWPITQALAAEMAVIVDFRHPDRVRLGLSPLTTSFLDVHTAVVRTARLVAADRHRGYPQERRGVT